MQYRFLFTTSRYTHALTPKTQTNQQERVNIWPITIHNGSLRERRKRGRVRAEPPDPKRTKGSFRRMVSIDRSTHPPPFIRRAGCHTSLAFPGRCQLLLHTIEPHAFANVLALENIKIKNSISAETAYHCIYIQ